MISCSEMLSCDRPNAVSVMLLAELVVPQVNALLDRFGLGLQLCDADADIPGSYWGDSEAGLIANQVYARADTPIHSLLHEACHYICMDGQRRAALHTDAGGEYAEEDAVCFLQIVLAEHLGIGRERMLADMDAWGYTFRLGSAKAWFEQDAADAARWLVHHGLITAQMMPTWSVRQ